MERCPIIVCQPSNFGTAKYTGYGRQANGASRLAGKLRSSDKQKTRSNVGYLTQPGSDRAIFIRERLSWHHRRMAKLGNSKNKRGGRHVSAIACVLSYEAGEKIRLSGEAAH